MSFNFLLIMISFMNCVYYISPRNKVCHFFKLIWSKYLIIFFIILWCVHSSLSCDEGNGIDQIESDPPIHYEKLPGILIDEFRSTWKQMGKQIEQVMVQRNYSNISVQLDAYKGQQKVQYQNCDGVRSECTCTRPWCEWT